jgi:tRNA(fMet)-specific endonuclease VapC
MSLYVLDTDMLSLYQRGHPRLVTRVDAHPAHEVAITVITVEEQMAGWYSQLRRVRRADELPRVYQRLADTIPLLARWPILSLSATAITAYESLRRMNLNVRKMDLRIAAIVLEHCGVLVTRNFRDFRRIPNLPLEDWTT